MLPSRVIGMSYLSGSEPPPVRSREVENLWRVRLSTGRPAELAWPAVRTSVTWWHAPKDANAPLTSAMRLVDQLPNARLVKFGEEEGHMAAYRREGEILDELLTRG